MAVIEDVRPLGIELERSYQVYVRGRLKFRVKQIVYVAFSLDERVMGFAFPKEERVCDGWAMCVPKFLVRERFGAR
jgi:hypothetical protein